jgi:hypothetical protein
MQFDKVILKEGTYGFMDYFFAISNVVCVFLNHTHWAKQVLMCRTEEICFVFRMIRAINLRDRYQLVLDMSIDLEFWRLIVTNLGTVISLTETTHEFSFNANTTLIAIIHLCFYTFEACSLSAAYQIYRKHVFAIKIPGTLWTLHPRDRLSLISNF